LLHIVVASKTMAKLLSPQSFLKHTEVLRCRSAYTVIKDLLEVGYPSKRILGVGFIKPPYDFSEDIYGGLIISSKLGVSGR
jgi:hypothetical protein